MSTQQHVLEVRPRRIVIWAAVSAAIILAVSITVGILLKASEDGVAFKTSDQIGVIGVGVVLAGCVVIAAVRPRLIADASGLQVRNMVGHRTLPWQVVQRISFPEGAQWPVLELADDETYPVIAIQAMDRERALVSIRSLRALFEQYAPPRPHLSAPAQARREAELLRQEQARPLGRLELQDLHRAQRRAARFGAASDAVGVANKPDEPV